MSKKAFVIILVLSLILNEIIAIADAIRRDSLLGGESGLPLRFSYTVLFGGGSINYFAFFIDIVFWFILIFVFWKVILKRFRKH